MIKVVLIGSGNVAKHLFNLFSENHAIEIVQVVSRNGQALKSFVNGVNSSTDFSKIDKADIYIIAVSDDAINTVSEQLVKIKGLIVHTSGSKPLNILSNHKRSGVFYPLQTFSKDRKVDFKTVPFCLEVSDIKDLGLLKELAGHMSEKIYEVSSVQRKNLHLAAVFVNNFTNHLYHIGNKVCEANDLPFEILNPLIRETVDKIEKLSPHNAQTGPARRNDLKTIKAHLALLEDSEEKEIYAVLSQSIQKLYLEAKK